MNDTQLKDAGKKVVAFLLNRKVGIVVCAAAALGNLYHRNLTAAFWAGACGFEIYMSTKREVSAD